MKDSDDLEQSDIGASEESTQYDNTNPDETAQPNNSIFDELTETDQISGIPAKPEPPVADIPTTPKTSNFKYLNVMEHVVENIARDYVGRLGGCTCEHCIADVTALTLNKLTPKYVVVEPPAASPLLNFYSSRFAPQVIVELTKSCFIVKENPHH
jgi:competence protein ComFB